MIRGFDPFNQNTPKMNTKMNTTTPESIGHPVLSVPDNSEELRSSLCACVYYSRSRLYPVLPVTVAIPRFEKDKQKYHIILEQ